VCALDGAGRDGGDGRCATPLAAATSHNTTAPRKTNLGFFNR